MAGSVWRQETTQAVCGDKRRTQAASPCRLLTTLVSSPHSPCLLTRQADEKEQEEQEEVEVQPQLVSLVALVVQLLQSLSSHLEEEEEERAGGGAAGAK